MTDEERASFLSAEPIAYCHETPLHGWEIAAASAASEEPELRWKKMVSLTDAEREAIKTAAGCMGLWMIEKGVAADESMRRAATTLRGLLERTK